MLKKVYFIRYFVLLSVFLLFVIIYTASLLNMQFANAYKYQTTIENNTTKTFTVSAVRGEIFDRNGVPLVTNQNVYQLKINGRYFPKKDYIGLLSELIKKVESNGCEIEPHTFPVLFIDNGDGSYIPSYSTVLSTSENEKNKLYRFLNKKNLDTNISAPELVNFLMSEYGLNGYEGDNLLQMLGLCYEFDRKDVAGGSEVILSKEINEKVIAVLRENSHNYPGVEVTVGYERIYNVPGAASHILGRVGLIPAGEEEAYKAKGYPMDAKVGTSGVEKAFEEYLRGKNGTLIRTYDQYGNVIEEKYKEGEEPIRGKDVYLTIDIKLQQIAEHSIETTIERIHKNSKAYANPMMNGGDAKAGAAVAINPNTGEILAMATYPSYNLVTYIDDYSTLAEDPLKLRPLTNRAVREHYPPGSIFKIATSVAALETGVVTVDEKIKDMGKYTKYASSGFAPTCWIYPGAHQALNITGALEHSCNYFYFVISERLGIEKLDEYARHFGLGVKTGIEIGEATGVLASREYADSIGEVWGVGQLLQAAIGQGYNVFTPLQTVTMLGTFLNRGTRYSSHLLYKVREFGAEDGEDFYVKEPEILDTVEMSDLTFDTVKMGLKNVIESGTAISLFRNFPVQVGGKTGTAERHTNESDLATFVSFAPYEEPEIAVSIIIENGLHGTWAGYSAEDILGYYFGVKSYNEIMDIPDEPEDEDEAGDGESEDAER